MHLVESVEEQDYGSQYKKTHSKDGRDKQKATEGNKTRGREEEHENYTTLSPKETKYIQHSDSVR
jgi:hypothetical protein